MNQERGFPVRSVIELVEAGQVDNNLFKNCVEYLQNNKISDKERSQLLTVLWTLDFAQAGVSELIETTVETAPPRSPLLRQFFQLAAADLQGMQRPKGSLIAIARLWHQLQPGNIPVLVGLINLHQQQGDYERGADYAEIFCDRAPDIPKKIAAHYLLLRCLLTSGGGFERARGVHQSLESLLQQLVQEQPPLELPDIIQGFAVTSFLPYLEDNPQKLHRLRRQVSGFLQGKVREQFGFTEPPPPSGQLRRVGYLSASFRRNSVGYLVRWLLKAHHPQLEVFAYSLRQTGDVIQQEIAESVSHFRECSQLQIPQIAQLIRQDELDLLIDLDSLTSSKATAVLALKPAPVQATWLGFDASGLPAIDYFLVSDRLLPDSAQHDYGSRIQRLPGSFIAVEGFEVGVPTRRREDLGIPPDAVVYLSSQTGAKRHPENGRSQLRILKQVPNSYFLIKGLYSDRHSLETFFTELAQAEGVNPEQLRFLPDDPTEAIHRANLSLADVVLDTFPYNGATTTLETLWMGIPVVTQVGQQFASRHSYEFLQQAGIAEGIATNAAEYVDWGVRLGCDRALREDIAWRLRQSRHTSPLWNPQQFAREMEASFAEMVSHKSL